MIATMDDHNRKPNTGMWDVMCSRLNGGVAPGWCWGKECGEGVWGKSLTSFCGDAAG